MQRPVEWKWLLNRTVAELSFGRFCCYLALASARHCRWHPISMYGTTKTNDTQIRIAGGTRLPSAHAEAFITWKGSQVLQHGPLVTPFQLAHGTHNWLYKHNWNPRPSRVNWAIAGLPTEIAPNHIHSGPLHKPYAYFGSNEAYLVPALSPPYTCFKSAS